jgi:hypothetical protein
MAKFRYPLMANKKYPPLGFFSGQLSGLVTTSSGALR